MAQHALAEEKADRTDLPASSLSPSCARQRALWEPGEEGLLGFSARAASGSGVPGTGRGDGPAQNERPVAGGGQFISVLLLFDVHTLVLFTTK